MEKHVSRTFWKVAVSAPAYLRVVSAREAKPWRGSGCCSLPSLEVSSNIFKIDGSPLSFL